MIDSVLTTEHSSVNINKPVLDLKEVAMLMDAHPKTIRLMAKAEKLPGFRVGSHWRFSTKRILEWIEETTYSAAA